MSKQLLIISKDNKKIEIDDDIIKSSILFTEMLKDEQEDEEQNVSDIYIPYNYDDIIICIDLYKCKLNLDNIEINILIKLLILADYLQIDKLENIICNQIALTLKGKNSTEIEKIFNITNICSQEEIKYFIKSHNLESL